MIHRLKEDGFKFGTEFFKPVEVDESIELGCVCNQCEFRKESPHSFLCGGVACLKHQRDDGKNVIWKRALY